MPNETELKQKAEMEKFKTSVFNTVPLLKTMPIEDRDWSRLKAKIESSSHKRMTIQMIIGGFATLQGKTYDEFSKSIDEHNPKIKLPRQAKVAPQRQVNDEIPVTRRNKDPLKNREDQINKNPYAVMDSPSKSIDLKKNLTALGARLLPENGLLAASPQPGFPVLKKKPRGTYYRPVLEKVGEALTKTLVFTSHSPIKPISSSSGALPPIKLPPNALNHSKDVNFTVTREAFKNRPDRRYPTQKTLKGCSASTVFAAANQEVIPTKHHWSHIEGLKGGGLQKEENLYPATAASNWSVLTLVEQYIENLLKNNPHISQIEVNAKIFQSDGDLIPTRVEYDLKWAGQKIAERVVFNPRSHQITTSVMRETIELIRAAKSDKTDEDPPATPSPPI